MMNRERVATGTTREVIDALGAVAFTWAVWALPDREFTRWVTEDGILEWLQVAALAVVLAVCAVQARRRRSLVWAAATVVMFVAVGEELAWGSRLFSLAVPAVQGRNVQGDLTIHNIGGLRGLSKTFAALAVLGFAGAIAVVRRRPGLAVWFTLPALYAFVRVVYDGPITSRFAKLSEILEFVLYAALVRVVVTWATRPAPAEATAPAAAVSAEPVRDAPPERGDAEQRT